GARRARRRLPATVDPRDGGTVPGAARVGGRRLAGRARRQRGGTPAPRAPRDAVRARPHAARPGPHPAAAQAEAAGPGRTGGGRRGVRRSRLAALGGDRAARAAAGRDPSRLDGAHADRAAYRGARRCGALESGDRRAGVRRTEDGRGESRPRLPEARHLLARAARPRARPRRRRDFVGSSRFSVRRRSRTVVSMDADLGTFVAECFWPGIAEGDLEALDARIRQVAAEERVRYLGSILMREDEVVLCQFEGSATAVRRAAERGGVRFERILAIDSTTGPGL